MIIRAPANPRAAGIQALAQAMPLPAHDAEERADRKLLRRMDIAEAVRK
jgi:hypothetical protein